MCGISFIVTNSRSENSALKASLNAMIHRGPDFEGVWKSKLGKAKLGHRRLSIIDLSETGNQPMHNEDKSIWLSCNGEIYNFMALRARLEGLGHSFYSHSDSEVVLHAYEQWGNECVTYLEGMFAFAIWDENKEHLFAARDRVGIKPLCYAQIPGGIAIASDFRALLPLLPYKPSPDPEAVAYVMTLGYVPAPLAIWKGLIKLEPGHLLTWDEKSGVKICCYWSPPKETDHNGDYTVDKWKELFFTVLDEHLLADVPLGYFLSGGLDSTTLAVGLHDLDADIKALTVSFPESPKNEEPYATTVSRHLNQQHEVLPITSSDIERLMDDVADAYDEPIGFSAILTQYAICKFTSQKFKAVLAGDGGDECFGGYIWHRANLSDHSTGLISFVRFLRHRIGLTGHSLIDGFLTRLYTGLGFSPLQKYSWNILARFLPDEAEKMMAPVSLRFDDEKWIQPLIKHFEPGLPLLRSLQRIDLMTFCSDCILPKVDRASMWHSLEVRVPFLDRRIIEWSLRKPLEPCELRQENAKPILRKFLLERIPPEVLNHYKQGFSVKIPLKYDWEKIYDEIDSSWWVKNGFWSKDWQKVINRGFSPKRDRIRFLMMLVKWAQKWLN